MLEKVRRYYAESGEGKKDVDGIEWFLTDGYYGWYRWKDGKLITKRRPNFTEPRQPCGMV